MIQVIQAQNVGLAYLEERFGLRQSESEDFFQNGTILCQKSQI
ncbi:MULTISPECIES: hypothetical protein [unclassified Tolypothrix]|nr:hypothetical protein FDUTEX481_00797 [Tolypothrix sp. PCC 7601]BAY92137.1 hypothetical protein NIES3275_41690 [Microchaete diplosiphon NIES-3275]